MIRSFKTPNGDFMMNMKVLFHFAFIASEFIAGKGSFSVPSPIDSISLFGVQPTAPTWVCRSELILRLPQSHTLRCAKCELTMKVCCGARELITAPITLFCDTIRTIRVFQTHLTNACTLARTVYCETGLGLHNAATRFAPTLRQTLTPPIKQITRSRTEFGIKPRVKHTKSFTTTLAYVHLATSMIFCAHIKQYPELNLDCQSINYDYCLIAENRLRQEVLAL